MFGENPSLMIFWSICLFTIFAWNKLIEKLIVQSQFHFGFEWMNGNKNKQNNCLRLLLISIFSSYLERINLLGAFWYWILKYEWRVYFNPYNNNNTYFRYINQHCREEWIIPWIAFQSNIMCVWVPFAIWRNGNGILPFVKSQIDVKHVQNCHQR